MKQETDIEKKAKSQNRQVIQNAPSGQFPSGKWMPAKSEMTHSLLPLAGGERLWGGFNIFLVQNKAKGPPGRARSPEVDVGLFSDHPPDFRPLGFQKPNRSRYKTDKVLVLNGRKTTTKDVIVQPTDEPFEDQLHTEYQIFINNSFLNFSQLNFLS